MQIFTMAEWAKRPHNGQWELMGCEEWIKDEYKDGKYICKMAIAKKGIDLLSQSVSEEVFKNKIKPIYDKIVNLHSKMYDEIIEVIKKVTPERLQTKFQFVVDVVAGMRSYLLVTAIKAGYLTIPEDFSKSMVGIAVYRS